MSKKYFILGILMAVVLLFSGCAMNAVTDYYCLPMRSEEYTNLQSLIQSAMTSSEYSAPVSGDNQQTVQSADLDGDGIEEYLLFAKDSTDRPLKIYIFSGDGTKYDLIDTIESTGSAHDRVEYIQMDDKAGYEIVVGRQVSDQVVRSVSVYTMVQGQVEQIMSTGYSEFLTCDLDGNGFSDVFVLRPGESGIGTAALYSIVNGTVERSHEVSMSEPADNINRIMFGYLADGVRAVYVASAVTGSSGIITDVYAVTNGQLSNVTFSNESGTSVQTLRNHYVYADDIDNDGILELPSLISMPTIEGGASSEQRYIIRWYAMTSNGEEVDKMYTFHNFVSGWYVELDSSLIRDLTVEQKGSSYEFGIWDETDEQVKKLMTIYVLTGQKREEQAITDNRFILYRTESTIYSGRLDVNSANFGMNQDTLISAFHLILQDWKTGET